MIFTELFWTVLAIIQKHIKLSKNSNFWIERTKSKPYHEVIISSAHLS